jgi:NAD(P)-dependent dehydrogenase (short-subunit alcohol dehydrogenase family)
MGRLDDKVALVTGSTRGLGEAIATMFAAEGAKVAVTGRSVDDGKRVAQTIKDQGGVAEFVLLDLSDEDSVKSAADQTAALFGKLDVLVNNAAPTEFVSGAGSELGQKTDDAVTELTTLNWHKITVPAFDGLFWMLKYSIPHLLAAGGGSIVNISSTASIRGVAGLDAYTACKGAMNALSRAVAVNYQPYVRCNTLIAGAFATAAIAPMLAIPKFAEAFEATVLTPMVGTPKHMAYAAVFFASDESAYITGQELPVDGGVAVPFPIPKIEV